MAGKLPPQGPQFRPGDTPKSETSDETEVDPYAGNPHGELQSIVDHAERPHGDEDFDDPED